MRRGSSSVTWRQPCNNQTALSVHQFGRFKKERTKRKGERKKKKRGAELQSLIQSRIPLAMGLPLPQPRVLISSDHVELFKKLLTSWFIAPSRDALCWCWCCATAALRSVLLQPYALCYCSPTLCAADSVVSLAVNVPWGFPQPGDEHSSVFRLL